MIPTSNGTSNGWTGTIVPAAGSGTSSTDLIITGQGNTFVDITVYCYLPELEIPKYVPTKFDRQLQKKSFKAIQKQHERRCR
jgi:hypothetical protein